jgi:hypothetical protein
MDTTLTEPRRDRHSAPIQHHTDAGDTSNPKPARNVAPGECWAFADHRTLAEIIAEGLL